MKKIVWIVLLTLLLSGCAVMDIAVEKNNAGLIIEGSLDEPALESIDEAQTPEPTIIRATISAVGDVLAHTQTHKSAKTADGYDFNPHFELVKEEFALDDYTIANLESPTAGEKYKFTGFPTFNAPVELSEALYAAGVDAVSTANNHALDKGFNGLVDNLVNLRTIGLEPFGTFATSEDTIIPTIVDVKGIRLGLLSYTYGTNGIPIREPYSVNLIDKEKITKDIQYLREHGAEAISVSMHWGAEYQTMPGVEQKELADFMAAQGVDIVLGCHPHVLQPMEMRDIEYNGKMKKMAIIWSMGNFYSAQPMQNTKSGVIYRVELTKVDDEVSVTDSSFVMTYVQMIKKSNGIIDFSVLPVHNPDDFADSPKYAEIKSEFERVNAHMFKAVAPLQSPSN